MLNQYIEKFTHFLFTSKNVVKRSKNVWGSYYFLIIIFTELILKLWYRILKKKNNISFEFITAYNCFIMKNLNTESFLIELLLIIFITVAAYYISNLKTFNKSKFGSIFNNLFTGTQEKYITGKQYLFKSILISVLATLVYFLFDQKSLAFKIFESLLLGSFLILRYYRTCDVYGINRNYYADLQKQIKDFGSKNVKIDMKYKKFIYAFSLITILDLVVIEGIILSGWNINYFYIFLFPGVLLQILLIFKKKINE